MTAEGGEEYVRRGNADCVGGNGRGHLHGGNLVRTWEWRGEDDVKDRLPLTVRPCHIKGSCKEKGLVVELNAFKEALGNGQLTNQEWLETARQLADGLIKHMTALSMLKTVNSRILS